MKATYHYERYLHSAGGWCNVSTTDAKRTAAEQELKSKAATLGGRWRLVSVATGTALVHSGSN